MVADMQKKLAAAEEGWKSETVDLAFVSLVEQAKFPTSPNVGKLLLFSLGVGVFLALAIPALIESFDRTVHNMDQAGKRLGLTSLGALPELELPPGSLLKNTNSSDGKRLAAAFQLIRSHFMAKGESAAPQVIVVTSALPQEGKTLAASNLARTFAQDGLRTLLVDADRDHGRVHRLFGYRRSPGLSNLLRGVASVEESCRATTLENLFILTAGEPIEAGSRSYAEKLGPIFAALRSHYDRIVVDAPPALGSAAAAALFTLKHVDGALLVVRSGATPAQHVKAAAATLKAAGVNLFGFILNGVSPDPSQNIANIPSPASPASPASQSKPAPLQAADRIPAA
jgi:receptor protein-tyrosine kinase